MYSNSAENALIYKVHGKNIIDNNCTENQDKLQRRLQNSSFFSKIINSHISRGEVLIVEMRSAFAKKYGCFAV